MEVYFTGTLQFKWIPASVGDQFDIRALLLGGYSRFIPLDKRVFYSYWKSLPSGSFLMLHITLTFFPLCKWTML